MKDWFYTLQILYLSLFKPSKLFEKINELPWYQGLLQQWIEDEKIDAQSKVLEIGSATGALSFYLSQRYEVMSVDNNPKMIKRAKEKYPHIKFEVANALHLPFENKAFDVVLASSLINVLDEKQQLLDEMLRVCKQNGKLMLLFPQKGFSDAEFLDLSSDLELKGFSKMALKMWHKLAKKMSLDSLEELLVEKNFSVVSSQQYLNGMVTTVVSVVKTHKI